MTGENPSSSSDNISSLKNEIERLTGENKLKVEQIKVLEKKMKEMSEIKNKFLDLKREYDSNRSGVEKFKETYQNEINKLNQTNNELASKWGSVQKEFNRLKAENEYLKSSLDDSQNKIFFLEETIKQNSAEWTAHENEYRSLIDEFSEANIKLQEKKNKLKKSIESMRDSMAKISSSDLSASQIRAIQDENNVLKLEVQRLKNDILQNRNHNQNNNINNNINNNMNMNIIADTNNNESLSFTREIGANEFSIRLLEADTKLLKYYDKREKQLKRIEGALSKNSPEARKLFIYDQLQKKILRKDVQDKLDSQSKEIDALHAERNHYEEVKKSIVKIMKDIENAKKKNENPLAKKLEKSEAKALALQKEVTTIRAERLAAMYNARNLFAETKRNIEFFTKLIVNFQRNYGKLIKKTANQAERMAMIHPMIEFFQEFQKYMPARSAA